MRKLICLLIFMPMLGWGQLPSSGPLSLRDIGTEFGYGLVPLPMSDLGTEIGITSGQLVRISDFYGESGTCTSVQVTDVKYSASSSSAACAASNSLGIYGNDAAFANCSVLWQGAGCTTYANTGWYSNGSIWKYWNATTAQFTDSGLCI